MKKRYLVLILLVIFGFIFWALLREADAPMPAPTDVTLNPEPAPAQKDDLIVVTYPLPQATVTSPLVVRGKARGNWYFEASFPISLVATDGTVLVETYAQATGDWMTTDYVPFTATLSYTVPATVTDRHGFLILRKDNPSGEPQFDNALTLPVTF